jgi:hypothetical protein
MNFSKKNHELKKSNRNDVSKTFKTLLIFLLIPIFCFAQNGINYKALIKDDLGNIVVNETTNVLFSILQDGVQVYREVHTTNTGDNGLVIVTIGEGNVISGIFEDINWDENNHSLNVRIDTGSGLVDLGTTPFNTVPYALSAANVNGLEAIDEGNGIGYRLVDRDPNNHGNVGLNAVDLSLNFTASTERGATGNYALATGFNTTASGTYATAMGRSTIASEFNTIAMGNQAIASSVGSISLGSFTTANGSNSTAIGSQTNATGDYSTALGSQTTASGPYSTALGRNTSATGNYATAMGRNTTAISYSTAMGDETEASASYSTAMGRQTTASGNNSTAFGRSTLASSLNATAMGNETEASGGSSTAMGDSTTASGNFSTAMGFNTTASSTYSTATGHYTSATGFMSTAMGNRTIAPSYAETVIGTYNTTYTPNASLSYDSNDRLFVIGNGESGSRSNAMVVLKNGHTGIGTDSPQELLHISGGRLRIGTETIEDTGSNQLSVDASLIPATNNTFRLGNSSNRWIGVWATDGTINTSDRRDKTNIKTITYGLYEILKMNPVSFHWKHRKNQDTKLGLIAQDLLELVPEVVKTHEWQNASDDENAPLKKVELERLGVYYSDLIPVLINAIKEQQKIIENQNLKINDLTAESKLKDEALTGFNQRLKQIETLINSNNQ